MPKHQPLHAGGGCGYLDHAKVGRAAIARLDEAHVPRHDVLGVDHLALAAADHRGLGGEHPLDCRGCLLGFALLDEACGASQQVCVRAQRGARLCVRDQGVVLYSSRGLLSRETVRVLCPTVEEGETDSNVDDDYAADEADLRPFLKDGCTPNPRITKLFMPKPAHARRRWE